MQDAGFKTNDNGLQFSLRDPGYSGQGAAGRDDAAARAASLDVPIDSVSAVDSPRSYGRHSGLGGGLDIRV